LSSPEGRAVAERVAVSHPGVRVLYMSEYTDDAVVRHGVLQDGVSFLPKPFSPAALAFKVREVLDAPPVSGDEVPSVGSRATSPPDTDRNGVGE
jgi:DNA-binding NarL/FixJ family response regulator